MIKEPHPAGSKGGKMKRALAIGIILLFIASSISISNEAGQEKIKNGDRRKIYQWMEAGIKADYATDMSNVSIDSTAFATIVDGQVFHIYEGLPWCLYVTAYWDPPQGQPICIWVDLNTLPEGARIIPEGCSCGIDSVTITLEWTPAIGQAGTYVIRFYVGYECYQAYSYFDITVIVEPYVPTPTETFRICAEEEFVLNVTAYWEPPQPEKLICLWIYEPSLPEGATFDECHCDYGSVTSTLRWTPSSDQVGEYIITFLAGEDCGYYTFPFSIKIIVEICEDNIPPTTTKIIGEPKYQEGFFVNSSTPFTLVAQDNEGGSGVKAIYYRIWSERTGWTEWKKYTDSFTLPETSGNCKYYIEYYAVDNAGNEEEIHNQTHVVDNERPYTTATFEGSYVSTSDHVIVGKNGKLELCGADPCCEKIKMVKFKVLNPLTFIGKGDYCKFIDHTTVKLRFTNTKGQQVEKICKLKPDGWVDPWHTTRHYIGEVTIDLGDAADCKLTLSIWYYDFDTSEWRPLPVFPGGKNEITITCKWIREVGTKGKAFCYTERTEPFNLLHLIVLKVLEFECTSCKTSGSGIDKEQYRIDEGTWIDLIDPEEIALLNLPDILKDNRIHKIDFRATDNLQQDECVKGFRIQVDTTPPETQPIESPSNDEETNAIPRFEWQNSTDPAGIAYILEIAKDPDFNNVVFETKTYFASFYELSIDHRLPQGKYYWRIKAVDLVDNEGEWSDTGSFIVGESNPPYKPSRPNGPPVGKTGKNYTYTASTTDPEGDKIYYNFSWGDGNYSGWIGPYASGDTASASHNWSKRGIYQVKVKAMDEYGYESEWSDPLPIVVPYSFNISIECPRNGLYVFGKKLVPLRHTIVIGPLKIGVSGNGLDKAEFYIDGKLKYVAHEPPFTWIWNEFAFGRHEIKVIVYDCAGNIAMDEQKIWMLNI